MQTDWRHKSDRCSNGPFSPGLFSSHTQHTALSLIDNWYGLRKSCDTSLHCPFTMDILSLCPDIRKAFLLPHSLKSFVFAGGPLLNLINCANPWNCPWKSLDDCEREVSWSVFLLVAVGLKCEMQAASSCESHNLFPGMNLFWKIISGHMLSKYVVSNCNFFGPTEYEMNIPNQW